jgi:TonB family protein
VLLCLRVESGNDLPAFFNRSFMRQRLFVITLLLLWLAPGAAGFGHPRPASRVPQSSVAVAVLDFGETEAGRRAAEHVARLLASGGGGPAKLSLLDRGLGQAAARGVGYRGSLNLTLREARDLGSAVGCDFLIIGDAQTLRRSPSERPAYFESYASIFVVSARTGRLVTWERPSAVGETPGRAEAALLEALDARPAARLAGAVADAHAREGREREERAGREEPTELIDLSSEGLAAEGVREPVPFRRIRPAYTEAAARAEAEATVDAVVDISAAGEVLRVEVVRWAGFGLDEAVVEAVGGTHFRPAERDDKPVPSRVLLRYNFRRPPPEREKEKSSQ